MDHLPPRNVIEHDHDVNRIQNLSLESHNEKLNLEADELKKQSKTCLGDDGYIGKLPLFYSPMSPCVCGGPMRHFAEPRKYWAIPAQKLYSADEDPARKEYSPLEAPSPRKYTKYFTTYVQKDDANSN